MEERRPSDTVESGGTATGEGQPRRSTSATVHGPKPSMSLTTHGRTASATKTSASPTSTSATHLPKATTSTSNVSWDEGTLTLTKQRSITNLKRKKTASATTIRPKLPDKPVEPFGESREEIYEEFVRQMNTLTLAPKTKITHGKPKARVLMVFMPTYRLEPIRPFSVDNAEKLMERVLDNIKPMKYDEATVPLLVQALSKCVISVVKLPSCNADRYKLACQVRIIEKKFQGFSEKLAALWAHQFDRIITVTVENNWMIATAVLSACYFD